jgi:hypothetical protein
MEDLNQLLNVWEKLGRQERNILLTYAARIYAGQRKYGVFDSSKKREWKWEAMEEVLDLSVYIGKALFEETEATRRRYLGTLGLEPVLDEEEVLRPEETIPCGAV